MCESFLVWEREDAFPLSLSELDAITALAHRKSLFLFLISFSSGEGHSRSSFPHRPKLDMGAF